MYECVLISQKAPTYLVISVSHASGSWVREVNL
jgi:hypothetical protein